MLEFLELMLLLMGPVVVWLVGFKAFVSLQHLLHDARTVILAELRPRQDSMAARDFLPVLREDLGGWWTETMVHSALVPLVLQGIISLYLNPQNKVWPFRYEIRYKLTPLGREALGD